MLHAHLDGATRPAIGGPPALPVAPPPLLLVVIDTEEEFDWHLPHSRDNTSVSALAAQGPAQQFFARHDIVPTYVVDYPVATRPEEHTSELQSLMPNSYSVFCLQQKTTQ